MWCEPKAKMILKIVNKPIVMPLITLPSITHRKKDTLAEIQVIKSEIKYLQSIKRMKYIIKSH